MKEPGLGQKMELVSVMTEHSLRLWIRFKLSFVFSLVSMVVSIATFFFVSLLVGDRSDLLADYGGDYFSFVLVGLAFQFYATMTLGDYLKTIRGAYWNNWMEMIITSPYRLRTFFASVMTWSYLYATINVMLYFVLGILVFGAQIPFPSHWWLVMIILILSLFAISGLGLLSASMFLLAGAKGGTEPVKYVVGTIAGIFSGVFFPVALIPGWLRPVGYVLPHTYALEGIRRALLTPTAIHWGSAFEWWSMWNILFMLIMFSMILVPLG
ncbi:MAG: ABC transporter permease, partial [Thermoplasmata archaeon]|nr:ABC transporter permease [Thermoplasmata archaeon]